MDVRHVHVVRNCSRRMFALGSALILLQLQRLSSGVRAQTTRACACHVPAKRGRSCSVRTAPPLVCTTKAAARRYKKHLFRFASTETHGSVFHRTYLLITLQFIEAVAGNTSAAMQGSTTVMTAHRFALALLLLLACGAATEVSQQQQQQIASQDPAAE